jgi:TldD protein
LLTVTADRASPSVTSVRWDDDGVEPVAGPVITDGRLVDYQTSRQTAPRLSQWYQQQRRRVASRGCAVAPDAGHAVQVRCGHLTVTPYAQTATLDDLIRDMPHGIVVLRNAWSETDQQLSSGSLADRRFEGERGRIVRRLRGAALQWSTLPFLKALSALGDQSTVADATGLTQKGQPWHSAYFHTTAPAALFREVNVVDIGRLV